jgi:NAD(P)-dependent dehydrogenase (short-subunit alcohol dehydrogenase family)
MKDRICLITGSTSGVGKAMAVGLAKLGATVIIISRSEQRCKFTTDTIKRRTGNNNIFYYTLDLGNLNLIPKFVEQFKNEFHALHVLSNNAAVLPLKKEYTPNGIEKIFAINYLSHFALTYSFMDFLKSSAPSRVMTVSGSPSLLKLGKIDLDDINCDKQYHPLKATYRAAVAKIAFSYELSKRLRGSGVTSNTFHPGLVKSNLTRHFPWLFRIAANFAQYFFSEDCETGVYISSSYEVEGVTGKFFKNKKIVAYNPRHSLDDYASALWEKSKELAGLS